MKFAMGFSLAVIFAAVLSASAIAQQSSAAACAPRGLASGSSIREIAKCLERAVSTESREVARHGGGPAYRASQADGAPRLNQRPRQTLGFQTPASNFKKVLRRPGETTALIRT
jgi:hypothetical protein